MSGLSGRKLALAIGVTSMAVSKAEARGRIRREENGLFDLEKARSDWARNTRRRGVNRVYVASEENAPAFAGPDERGQSSSDFADVCTAQIPVE